MSPTEISSLAEADPEKLAPEELTVDEMVGGAVIDSAMEKRVLRKLDLNLVTLVSVLYMLSFLDRSNIGNAKIVCSLGR